MTFPTGSRVGPFEIRNLLGEGGMGKVYLAHDHHLEREVAIKFLSGKLTDTREAIERFQREARLLAALNHPNVATLHGFELGEVSGRERHFLVMELVEGETLQELLHRRPLTVDEAIPLLLQLTRGLEAAHERQIVHRDLKPGNVKVTPEGLVKILDFGIAKRLGKVAAREEGLPDEETLERAAFETAQQSPMGTVSYMSPEQLRGQPLDKRTDIWSFGCVLYEALRGRSPFEAPSPAQRIAAILTQPPDLAALPDDVPSSVLQLLRRCLEKDPRRRLRDIGEARIQLESLAQAHDTGGIRGQEDSTAKGSDGWSPREGESVPSRSDWKLVSSLGEGTFGAAWLARHVKSDRQRVFKFCTDEERLRGLKREIVLLRILQRSLGDRGDVAGIYDWQLDEAPQFLATEYAEHGDLLKWAEARGGLEEIPLTQRLEVVARIADALAAAHGVGILHKDVKPANVLLAGEPASPRALLADFGIGLLTERGALDGSQTVLGLSTRDLMEGGRGLGSHLYMAPELVEGRPATTKSDVYSLGVLLYQMVIGDFSRALATGWPEQVDDPLLRQDIAACVDGDPSKRTADLPGLATRLRTLEERGAEAAAALERERDKAEMEQRRQREHERLRGRRRRWTAAAMVGAVASLVLGGVAWRESQRADAEKKLREDVEQAIYAGDIQRAQIEIEQGNLSQARQILESAPPARRNWEWGHLAARVGMNASSSVRDVELRTGSDVVELWRGATPVVVATLHGHRNYRQPGRLEFFPSGHHLISAIGDQSAKVWNPAHATELADLPGSSSVYGSVPFRDGRRVVTIAEPDSILWDTTTGEELHRFPGQGLDFFSGWITPDQRYLITSHFDSRYKIWQIATGELIRELPTPRTHAMNSEISMRLHFTGDDSKVWVPWDFEMLAEIELATGEVLQQQEVEVGSEHMIRSLSNDGRWIIAGTRVDDGAFRIVERNGARAYEYPEAVQISVSRDDRLWALVDRDGTLALRDGPGGADLLASPFRLPTSALSVAISNDGSRLAYFDTGNNSIQVLGPANEPPVQLSEPFHETWVRDATYSRDASVLVTASHDHTATVWDLDPPRLRLRLVEHEGPLQSVRVSPDASRIVTSSWDGRDALWDGRSGALLFTTENGSEERTGDHTTVLSTMLVHGAQPFSPDSRSVVVAGKEGEAKIVDSTTGEILQTLSGSDGYAGQFGWSSDGSRIFTVGWRASRAQLWSPDGSAIQTLTADGELWRVEFSPSGDRLAGGATGGAVYIWDTTRGEELHRLQADEFNVGSVHWSRDGRFVIATSINRRARLWDADTGDLVSTFCCNNGDTFDSVLSPDGSRALTISYPDELKLWDLEGNSVLTLTPPDGTFHVEWSPDGSSIVAPLTNGAVQLWTALPWESPEAPE